MKMVTPEKILQTMNSWQSGEVIAVRRKKCSGASSHPNVYCYAQCDLNKMSVSVQWFPVNNLTADLQLRAQPKFMAAARPAQQRRCAGKSVKCKIAEL